MRQTNNSLRQVTEIEVFAVSSLTANAFAASCLTECPETRPNLDLLPVWTSTSTSLFRSSALSGAFSASLDDVFS